MSEICQPGSRNKDGVGRAEDETRELGDASRLKVKWLTECPTTPTNRILPLPRSPECGLAQTPQSTIHISKCVVLDKILYAGAIVCR